MEFRTLIRLKIAILGALVFLAICVFYLFFFKFAVNIPFSDDYCAILGFVDNFLVSNFKDKIILIFSQHNEHRLVFLRIITLLTYYLSGKINLKLLAFLGSISLLGLLLIFSKVFNYSKNRFTYFCPVIFLLFQPAYWGAVYFATPALSNLYVIFFAFLSLYLLTKPIFRYFLFSLLLAILATFTQGNGMLVFFAGLLPLILQKRYKEIILWSLIGIGCILFYFNGYIKPAHHPAILATILSHPFQTAVYFFHFIGLSFGFSSRYIFLSLPLGVFSFISFIYLIKIEYYKKNTAIFSFLLFLFFTTAVATMARSGLGIQSDSRYKITSVLFIILFYFSIIEIMPQKAISYIFPIMLVLSIIFNLFFYHRDYNSLIARNKCLMEGLALWKNNGAGTLSHPDQNHASAILSTAIAKKYYFPPVNGEKSFK